MDEGGKRKYKLKEIEKLTKKKYRTGPKISTIAAWAAKNNWDQYTQDVKNLGLAQYVLESQEKDEEIKEAVQDFYAGIVRDNAEIRDLADYLIKMRLQYEVKKLHDRQADGDLTDEDFTFDTDKLNRMAERATGILIDKKTPQISKNIDEKEIDESIKKLTKKLGL
jgi:D-mannonate dehydratase